MEKAAATIIAAHNLFSLGDIATVQATREGLARRGVTSVDECKYTGNGVAVVGGGHILGAEPHLNRYRVHGRHVLNAVAANENGDYGYLKEYSYRSVRDHVSREHIECDAEIVPCPAVLLNGWGETQGPQGYIVAHNDPIVMRALRTYTGRILVVDPQPWRHHRWTDAGDVLPPIANPREMISICEGANVVVCRSLHLSVFALAAGRPFVCIDCGDEPQSNKMREYWHRADIGQVMHDGEDPITQAARSPIDWQGHRTSERQKASQHLDRIAEVIL